MPYEAVALPAGRLYIQPLIGREDAIHHEGEVVAGKRGSSRACTTLGRMEGEDAKAPADLRLAERDGFAFAESAQFAGAALDDRAGNVVRERRDRKSTRLNSSHRTISYAVFCLKKKKKK